MRKVYKMIDNDNIIMDSSYLPSWVGFGTFQNIGVAKVS